MGEREKSTLLLASGKEQLMRYTGDEDDGCWFQLFFYDDTEQCILLFKTTAKFAVEEENKGCR